MNCRQAEALIVHAADGCLEARERQNLEAHTAACPECRERLADQTAVATVLRNRPMSTTPTGLTDAVMARVTGARGWLGAADWRRWSIGLVPVMAAAVVTAAVIVRAPSGSPTITATAYASADAVSLLLEGRLSTGDDLIDLALGGVMETRDANERASEESTE